MTLGKRMQLRVALSNPDVMHAAQKAPKWQNPYFEQFYCLIPSLSRRIMYLILVAYGARCVGPPLIPFSTFPLQAKGNPQLQMKALVHYRLASSVGFDRIFVCSCHFAVAGGQARVGCLTKQSPHCSPHTVQPQLVPSVISSPCHMIWSVCNNTQGACAALEGNEMIHL